MAERTDPVVNRPNMVGKLMFSHRRTLEHLFGEILVEGLRVPWTGGRKLAETCYLDRMEQMRGEHVDSETGREFRQDVVWRVPLRGGGEGDDIYIVVMVELQSTVDWSMAVRVRRYVDMIYMDLFTASETPSKVRLPLVLPIVFYTGRTEWRAATSLRSIVRWEDWDDASREPGSLFIGGSYVLLSVRELAEQPLPPDNMVSLYVAVEAFSSLGTMGGLIDRVCGQLAGSEQETLRRALLSRLLDKVPPGLAERFMGDIGMIERHYEEGTWEDELDRQWARIRDEERKEGLEQGLERGREEERVRQLAGQRNHLLRLSADQFGEEETARLTERLEGVHDQGLMFEIAVWINECQSAEDLDDRIGAALRNGQ